jgi:uncharacterized protein
MKYLVLVLVVGVALLWVMGRGRRSLGARKDSSPRGDGAGPEAMVSCAHCGVHLPREDALVDGDHSYCSPAHRLAGPAPRG